MNNTVWKTGGQGYGTQVLLHAIFVEGARLLLTLTIGRVSSVGTASERRGGYKRQPMRCIVISTEPISGEVKIIYKGTLCNFYPVRCIIFLLYILYLLTENLI